MSKNAPGIPGNTDAVENALQGITIKEGALGCRTPLRETLFGASMPQRTLSGAEKISQDDYLRFYNVKSFFSATLLGRTFSQASNRQMPFSGAGPR